MRFLSSKVWNVLRLIVQRVRYGAHGPIFEARLDGKVIATSYMPIAAGARELLKLGYDPDTPLTMRHHDREHDSFRPQPIRWWAQWTYSEGGRRLARQKWIPLENRVGPLENRVGPQRVDCSALE